MALVVGDLWCLDSFVAISIIKFSQLNYVAGVTRDQPHNTLLQMSHGVPTICVDSILFHFVLISRATDFRGAFIIKRAISISIRSRNETHIPHIVSFSFKCEMVGGGSDKNNHRSAQSSPNEEEEIPEILWLDSLFLSLVNVAKLTLTSLFFFRWWWWWSFLLFCLSLSWESLPRFFLFLEKHTHTQAGGEECSLLIGWDLARTSGPGKWLEGVDIYTGPTPIHTPESAFTVYYVYYYYY